MPRKWYEAQVVEIIQESPQTKRFFLDVGEAFEFRAGQFVVTDLPIGEKRLQRWRSYSLANSPSEKQLEMCIVRLGEGAASNYFHNDVKIDDTIKFKGPEGTFCLPEKIEHDLILICTGTGLAPFRSMLLDIQDRNIDHHQIHLIFGSRTHKDILYKSELEQMSADNPNFHYHIALSREPYEGKQGYVHEIYMDSSFKVGKDAHYYICGWSQMIDDAVANLIIKKGIDKSRVHYELYG
jgi:CDP-4-dehydro-6-deoxyglucose reductase